MDKVIGISYPFRKDKGQFPAVDKNVDCVKSDLITLFRTPIRSRVMRPTYGTIVHELVFEEKDTYLGALIDRTVKQSISVHEPRVVVNDLLIQEDTNGYIVDIQYAVQGVKDNISLEIDNS